MHTAVPSMGLSDSEAVAFPLNAGGGRDGSGDDGGASDEELCGSRLSPNVAESPACLFDQV